MPLSYREERLDVGFRIDLLVGAAVIVEVKSVERVHPLVEAQVLTYLKLAGLRRGSILNFNSVRLKDGIRRLVR